MREQYRPTTAYAPGDRVRIIWGSLAGWDAEVAVVVWIGWAARWSYVVHFEAGCPVQGSCYYDNQIAPAHLFHDDEGPSEGATDTDGGRGPFIIFETIGYPQ